MGVKERPICCFWIGPTVVLTRIPHYPLLQPTTAQINHRPGYVPPLRLMLIRTRNDIHNPLLDMLKHISAFPRQGLVLRYHVQHDTAICQPTIEREGSVVRGQPCAVD
jgi:hypothetical protein